MFDFLSICSCNQTLLFCTSTCVARLLEAELRKGPRWPSRPLALFRYTQVKGLDPPLYVKKYYYLIKNLSDCVEPSEEMEPLTALLLCVSCLLNSFFY